MWLFLINGKTCVTELQIGSEWFLTEEAAEKKGAAVEKG